MGRRRFAGKPGTALTVYAASMNKELSCDFSKLSHGLLPKVEKTYEKKHRPLIRMDAGFVVPVLTTYYNIMPFIK